MASGLEAWKAGRTTKAEDLLKRGIAEYKRREPSGAPFALGRYGAFLLQQDRVPEAERVLAEAISARTDIPAVWDDYLKIQALKRDVERFRSTLEEMARCVRGVNTMQIGLAHARRAMRSGDLEFAESLARGLYDDASASSDRQARWAAAGDLGQVLEKCGRVDEAIALWQEAFGAGSDDATTASRLAMALEHAKDYEGAARIIREGLSRGLPASTEEQLRKRLARCDSKVAGGGRKARDVEAFSVRYGGAAFELYSRHGCDRPFVTYTFSTMSLDAWASRRTRRPFWTSTPRPGWRSDGSTACR